jgi:hypothetical protein
MGACGVGMMMSDAAWDTVCRAKEELPRVGAAGLRAFALQYRTGKRLSGNYVGCGCALLGLAAWLCKHTRGARIKRKRIGRDGRAWVHYVARDPYYTKSWWWRRIGRLVLEAIDFELNPECLKEWRGSDERKGALERFRAKLLGQKYDHLEMEIDDMPIGARIRLAREYARCHEKRRSRPTDDANRDFIRCALIWWKAPGRLFPNPLV